MIDLKRFQLSLLVILAISGSLCYEIFFSDRAKEMRLSVAICESIKPGMPIEKVKEIASASMRPLILNGDVASVGYELCGCTMLLKKNLVLQVGGAICAP